ncbi:MAG: class I SAM-dependent methyltransferase [Burkholderiales bacterium]|nr:class I SAM-dependent methyltransferase [Burkholderiales bacterium]
METRLFGRVEQRLRDLGLPLGVTLWNGQSLMPQQAPRLKVTVRSIKALASLVNPSMGKLARHYVEQELDVEGDARELVRMSEALSETSATEHGANFHWRRWMRHSRLFDRKAIRYHYDVNDDFFGLWLDKHRVYSCAYYRRADDTLDVAQEQKLDLICRKLQLQPGERFLDIGCGWGALLMWAARHYKARATGITLSSNQHQYAMRQIREQGLEKLCEVRLMDYRDLPENEPFDKVASVGMFEHVGRKNLPHYFAKIYRVLKPGGLVLNHGITLNSPDQNELGSDIGEFIEDYVFPGGELVHISRVIDDMSSQGLECWDIESLRPHYARTLWHWVGRLEANRDAVLAMVDEKVFRIWHVYMAGSAHGFERGWMSIYQVLAGRPFADGTLAFPLTRDYINET